MRKPIPEIIEKTEDLKKQLHKEKTASSKQKIHLLHLLKSGKCATRISVASHLAVHRNTVGRWLNEYEADGIQAMLQRETPGPRLGQRTLSDSVIEALKERLEEQVGFGSYGEIQKWLAERFGVEINYHTLYGIVRCQLGAKLKVPRKNHEKKTKWRSNNSVKALVKT